MNILTLLLSVYLAVSTLTPSELEVDPEEWKAFKETYEKTYENDDIERMRKTVYAYNRHKVANQEEGEGFTIGLNHLADMSMDELKAERNGFRGSRAASKPKLNTPEAEQFLAKILESIKDKPIPESVDWRQSPGRVGKVHDQGQCGSCWAFAAVGALEGQEYKKAAGKSFGKDDLVDVSVQNLIDCDQIDNGCGGGLMDSAFLFIARNGGLDDDKSYPYEAETSECRFKPETVAIKNYGSVLLPSGDENILKQIVSAYGPVSIAIDASSDQFQLYKSGVYNPKTCGSGLSSLDHGVLLVGYGTDPKEGEYWIVKNSWGPKWGEDGYIKMARNKKNKCGVATFAVIPIV